MKTKKREGYLDWDTYFMSVAMLSAMRSKDPNTQVGACIVDKTNRILSIGYNGTPNGFHGIEKEILLKLNIFMLYMQKEMQF